jgi:hypothetical protein
VADETGNSAQEAAAVAAVQAVNYAAADALLELERLAADAATALQRAVLQVAFTQTAAQYATLFGSIQNAADPVRAAVLTARIVEALDQVRALDYATPLQHYSDIARVNGVNYANRYLSDRVAPESVARIDSVGDAIGGVAQSVADVADRAAEFIGQQEITGFSDLQTAMGRAAQVSNPVKSAATWAVNRSSSGGIASVAVARGGRLLWVAERDACVVCLALSGSLCDPGVGEGFDETATFGKPGSAPDIWPYGMPLMSPPRHPHCRCHPELWFGPSTPMFGPQDNAVYNNPLIAAGVDLPAALRREAKRSVLRGWSMPSESLNQRINAADRLLAAGAGMPRTVEERAAKAVKNRKFSERSLPAPR